jgi:hypothetical protein
MAAPLSGCRIATALLVLFVFAGACISVGIGEVSYKDGDLVAVIKNSGEPADAYIQITVYRIQDLHQQEFMVVSSPVRLNNGENAVSIPAQLGPGNYKLYVYCIQDGERKTAVIRDIVV